MNKKVISMLLCALICQSAISCGSEAKQENTDTSAETAAQTTEAVTEEPRLEPDLPDQDFGGYEFHILTRGQSGSHWDSKDIDSEGLNGDPINDAVYNRNSLLEDRYNFKVVEVTDNNALDPSGLVRKAVRANDDCFDLTSMGASATAGLATENMLLDLTSIPHVDLSKPWYDQSANSMISIGNKLFMTTGDLNIADNDATWVILFNKKLAGELDLPNLYTLTKEGKWTIDKMTSYAKNASVDLDGNGVHDEFDQWGLQGEAFNTTAFVLSCGGKVFDKDSNDIPFIAAQTERFASAFVLANELNGNQDFCMLYENFDDKYTDAYTDVLDKSYKEGRVLFTCTGLNRVTMYREMETDFGILPLPKYDETQEKYHDTVSHWGANMVAIPKTASNLERTGILLEALSAESKYTLTPAYYDVALKAKAARDTESADMLDLIFEARVFELGNLFGWGGMFDVPSSLTVNGQTDISSAIQKKVKSTEKAMQRTIDAYLNAD